MRRAVLLDRDDTLIANREATQATPFPGDLFDPSLVRLLPGVGDAMALLKAHGFLLVVVSNQGALSLGRCSLRDVEATNDRMRSLLAVFGVTLAGSYFSPAREHGTVVRFAQDSQGWRKPLGGMIRAAAAELDLDLRASWLVGDTDRDTAAGIAGGIPPAHCLRIGTPALPGLPAAATLIIRSPRTPDPAPGTEVSSGSLRALVGTPLADEQVRRVVTSAAHALAERTGVRILGLTADESSISATIEGDEVMAVGFVAEVRRVTNAWYASRNAGASLWGDPRGDAP
jgi:histidinol-phosphate phosphatase family protein